MLEPLPEYCDQLRIEEFGDIPANFFRDVLGMSLDACLYLSEDSELDDFSAGGLPDNAPDQVSWEKWVIEQIEKHYGITLTTTRVTLLSLFQQINKARKAVRH